MDTTDPDLHALTLTIGIAVQLTEHGTPEDWASLTHALEAEHTPAQLANMLTGAAAIIARAPSIL